MAEAKIYISNDVDRKLRESAMKKFGYGRGSISKAAEEAIIQWLSKEEFIQDRLGALVEKAKSDKEVVAVLLYGSYARNEPNCRDIDVALLLGGNKKIQDKLFEYSKLLVSDLYRFDVVILNNLPIDMKVRILKEGMPLYVSDRSKLYSYSTDIIKEDSDYGYAFNAALSSG
jgi:predicted nucleotidyltransferase